MTKPKLMKNRQNLECSNRVFKQASDCAARLKKALDFITKDMIIASQKAARPPIVVPLAFKYVGL